MRPGLARAAILCAAIVVSVLSTASAQVPPPPASEGRSTTELTRRAGVEAGGVDAADTGLVTPPSDTLAALAGKPIRAVSVETVGNRWKSRPAVKSVTVGELLTHEVARRALAELLDSGAFAQGYADARAYEDGVILRLVMMPRRVVAGIRVQGDELDKQRMLNAAELAEGDEVTEPMLRRIAASVRSFYRNYGYDRAIVTVDASDTDDPMEVLLDIDIDAGERRTVTRRIFVIEPQLDRLVGDLKQDYEVGAGDDLDEDALAEADNDMVERLRHAGFLDARVEHQVLRRGDDAFLYVYLETGPRYTFVFEGDRREDEDDLEDALALDEPTTDTTPAALGERLQRYYQERGYYDAEVKVQERKSADGAELEVRFVIRESQPLRVARRLYPCLPVEAPDDLGPADLDSEIDAVLDETLPGTPLFHEVDEGAVDRALGQGGGSRAPARRLDPAATYTPEAYDKALKHLEQLLNSKGYLDARVGPVTIVRATCNPRSRAGRCDPLPLPAYRPPRCRHDALEMPIPEAPLPEAFTCVPDPLHGVHCSPDVVLYIPIQLGPQMRLYDMVFEGNTVIGSHDLYDLAEYPLGEPFSNVDIDAAQNRIVETYRNMGYAYASVRVAIDHSPDRTRARARFVISEHKPVVIDEYEVRGAERTEPDLVLSRLSLCSDVEDCERTPTGYVCRVTCSGDEAYFKKDLVRESEEQIATLGTFSSVAIALEDPDLPQERKRVIITVTEIPSQYIAPSVGFFTGDGFRVGIEYGHRNIGGLAIALTLRLELAYLPEFLILDPDVRKNYEDFSVSERLERRNTGTLRFPDIGLGPKFDLVVSGVDARDNQRDFGISREAFIPTLGYRPVGPINLSLGASVEVNDVTLFSEGGVEEAIRQNPALATLLRVPEGRTVAFSQRLAFTWDGRDKPLEATRGGLIASAVEHVTALPLEDASQFTSEFLKLTLRGAGYVPLGSGGMALALSLATGYNLQLTSDSKTYPDRLFFLGGVGTMRGFQLDELVPQDIADQILDGDVGIDDVGVRGGDLFVNPRAELRIPLTEILGLGIFVDAGNLWSTIDAFDDFGEIFRLRYTAGAGVRFETPLGPVALDYGVKLARYPWEDFGALHFSIGLF
jgi:outer membrane protein insertion porin family